MFNIVSLISAFGGGIFGAAIGAQPAFIFVGFLVLVGVAIQAAGGGGDYFGIIPFGVFGPHVGGFAAGVAAAAYAANKGKLTTGRDVASGLMGLNSPDVLLVGGIFGIVGYAINWAFSQVGFAWTDTVALTVVVSAIIARLIWGKTGVFGKVVGDQSRYAPNDATKWLPWESDRLQLLVLGLGVGLMSSYFAIVLGASKGGASLGFGLSAASLILLQYGTKIPVTHHISLCAAVAAAASGSFIWGSLFGVLAAFFGEFVACTFLVHGDTHIDPPAATIAPLTSFSLLLAALGVYQILPLF